MKRSILLIISVFLLALAIFAYKNNANPALKVFSVLGFIFLVTTNWKLLTKIDGLEKVTDRTDFTLLFSGGVLMLIGLFFKRFDYIFYCSAMVTVLARIIRNRKRSRFLKAKTVKTKNKAP